MDTFKIVGISYKKANEEIRGKFSLSSAQQTDLLDLFHKNKINGFVISTCNRTEIYTICDDEDLIFGLWNDITESTLQDLSSYTYVYEKEQAFEHLFKVGCGLESQILGDFEITNQLKKAFVEAKQKKVTNGYLERLVNSVLQSSKEVRSKTKISNGTTSVSYVAVDYIKSKIKDYTNKNVLMYGLGEIGKLTIENLYKHLPSNNLAVINRTESKAQKIATKYVIQEFKHENLNDAISKADILIVATNASQPTIKASDIGQNPITIFDLSIPKNVDPEVGHLDNVNLLGLDVLSKTINSTLNSRKSEIPIAMEIVNKHLEAFKEWDSHQQFSEITIAFKEKMLAIKDNEIAFQTKKLENANIEHLNAISDRLIQKITTKFIKHLKKEESEIMKAERIELIKNIFDL